LVLFRIPPGDKESEQNSHQFENGLNPMGLWLLSFTGGGIAVIIKAESLSHARLLVAARGFSRASLFDEGYVIDPDLTIMIPNDLIGRGLSQDEAANLLKLLISRSSPCRPVGTAFWQPVCPQRPGQPLYHGEPTYLEAVASPAQYGPEREHDRFQSAIASDVIREPQPVPVDDLSAPLGLGLKSEPARRPIFTCLAAAGLFGMAIAGFAVWRAAPATRSPAVVPAPHHGAAVILPDLRSELRSHDPVPSADTYTSVRADLVTTEKAQENASETNVDTLQANPNERIITIVDGRDGTRRHIRVPATR
jgi:hypothetical protein